jgi:hypothetical protein
MAFNTNVLRDGQWVTETVDYGAALKASSDAKAAAGIDHERGPLGVLSRTIVSSPVVNFILPVSLRSRDYNDIAYIGVSIHVLSGTCNPDVVSLMVLTNTTRTDPYASKSKRAMVSKLKYYLITTSKLESGTL